MNTYLMALETFTYFYLSENNVCNQYKVVHPSWYQYLIFIVVTFNVYDKIMIYSHVIHSSY